MKAMNRYFATEDGVYCYTVRDRKGSDPVAVCYKQKNSALIVKALNKLYKQKTPKQPKQRTQLYRGRFPAR